jgi:hypothetical protein
MLPNLLQDTFYGRGSSTHFDQFECQENSSSKLLTIDVYSVQSCFNEHIETDTEFQYLVT